MRYSMMAIAGAALLSGCGGSESGPAAGTGGSGADWAMDACKTFPAEAAGKAAGLKVTATQSSPNMSNTDVKLSNCTYTAEGGALFSIGLRHDLGDGSTMDEVVAGLKGNTEMTGPVEEIPAPAGKAFWTPRLKTLTYLPQAARLITVTPPGADVLGGKSDPDDVLTQRAMALALAQAVAKTGS